MSTRWFETTTESERNAYCHEYYLSSSDHGDAVGPQRKSIFDLQSAESSAWKTLATILPRAAPLPELSSLMQHHVFSRHPPMS